MIRKMNPKRREKLFGDGRPRALDRNAKVRVMVYARAIMRRTVNGKAYGAITAKAFAVLESLLWSFHNARSGLCFPSYDRIAERTGCARSTVALALKALEAAGVLTWVNRIVRVRERCVDLLGNNGTRLRVIRTSNGYVFNDPKVEDRADSSKSDFHPETMIQESISLSDIATDPPQPLDSGLATALERLRRAMGISK